MTSMSVAPEYGHYTTINIFHTSSDNQADLVAALAKGMYLLDQQPGFVSTSVHESDDGTLVVSYVQWESEQAFKAMRARTDAQDHFRRVGQLVTSVDTISCRVVQTHTP